MDDVFVNIANAHTDAVRADRKAFAVRNELRKRKRRNNAMWVAKCVVQTAFFGAFFFVFLYMLALLGRLL